MEVTEDQVETPAGKQFTYGVVRKGPFALVIPWDGSHVTLVGQYRYPIDAFSWEFPQGHFSGNSIEQTARNELQEETGLRAKTIRLIGTFYVADGYSDQEGHIFIATDLTQGKPHRDESEEDMQVRTATLTELEAMITKRQIKDGPTIVAYTLAKGKMVL